MDNPKPATLAPIDVVWHCGMGADCTNQETPGEHRGDYGYDAAHDCVHQHDPAGVKRLKQK